MASKAIATSSKTARAGIASRKSNKIYCYIGPNIRGHLHTGQVFRGEREDILRENAGAVGKYPLVKALLIPGESLPVARLKVKEPGTAHYANFCRLRDKLLEEARNQAEKEALRNA